MDVLGLLNLRAESGIYCRMNKPQSPSFPAHRSSNAQRRVETLLSRKTGQRSAPTGKEGLHSVSNTAQSKHKGSRSTKFPQQIPAGVTGTGEQGS